MRADSGQAGRSTSTPRGAIIARRDSYRHPQDQSEPDNAEHSAVHGSCGHLTTRSGLSTEPGQLQTKLPQNAPEPSDTRDMCTSAMSGGSSTPSARAPCCCRGGFREAADRARRRWGIPGPCPAGRGTRGTGRFVDRAEVARGRGRSGWPVSGVVVADGTGLFRAPGCRPGARDLRAGRRPGALDE
jgi:hypothetical protein